MLKGKGILVAFLLGSVLLTVSAKADQLIAGASGNPDTFSIAYAGTALAYGPPAAYGTINAGSLSFQYLMEVDADPSNVYCTGCLDFILQVLNDSNSTTNITRVTWSGFSGYQTDVGYDLLSVGDLTECGPGDNGFCQAQFLPLTVDRDATGDIVGFNFSGVTPDEATVDMVIETNALTFTDPPYLSVFALDGSNSLDLQAFGPSGPPAGGPATVPEPSSLILFGSGVTSLIGILRRRIIRGN